MGLSTDDDEDKGDVFFFAAGVVVVGLSPNPLPAMRRSVRGDDDDVVCRCRRTIEGGEGRHEEERAVKADAGSGEEMTDMMQRCARGTTATAVMAVVIRAVVVVVVATMIFIFGVSLRASARGGCVRGLRLEDV
jgi:hypothetical protein